MIYQNTKRLSATLLLAVILLTALLTSCSGNASLYTEGDGELNVVCTIFPPFDFAKNVGKDKVTLTLLQSNGADLHNFSPTVKTLEALSKADVFICVGGTSDTWVDQALSAAGNADAVVIKLTSEVELMNAELSSDWDGHDHSEHEHEHVGDEHVWTSLRNVSTIVSKIATVFSQKDPENASFYTSNAENYQAELSSLDAEYGQAVSNATHKTLVFADRFPFVYLTHDYKISYYAAFGGCSTETNATIEMRKTLTDAVKASSLPAVITIDGSSDTSLADAICADTGCVKLKLNSMQSITRADIENGASYLQIMKDNLNVLKQALG